MPSANSDIVDYAFVDPALPALKSGAATGISGFLVGGAVGILRSAHPALVAGFTGTQFFVLGSSFVYSREAILRASFSERTKNAHLISSTAAGALSGAAAGAFYGKVNSIAGALLVGTVGHLGQRYVHAKAGAKSGVIDKRPLLDRLADSKWVPFRSLSNNEYETMLNEKLLKVQAEILMIDEKIRILRDEEQQIAGDNIQR